MSNATLAVIKTGGKQYLVSPGQKLKIEKIEKEVGEEIVFDKVLLVSQGKKTSVGSPYLAKTVVKANVIAQDSAKKVTTIKFKPKTRYKKKIGHRQPYTEVEITKIEA
ncbi:50S ribosomal protein L21 [Candidatus Parcubacteria bacterium]|nr:50S ribosomal protein L21 [Patescibacteria group bacterium]MBU4466538.1 50S ribosomal protein L21 [Patescibacteria group bacterium]MCG2688818.1 50S ribosomal protein L21 [Candidatus Parcubacteria bacterium]